MPLLRAGKGGSIVAIASGTALWTEMELGAYSVSKRALIMLTRMLAVEAGPDGVTRYLEERSELAEPGGLCWRNSSVSRSASSRTAYATLPASLLRLVDDPLTLQRPPRRS